MYCANELEDLNLNGMQNNTISSLAEWRVPGAGEVLLEVALNNNRATEHRMAVGGLRCFPAVDSPQRLTPLLNGPARGCLARGCGN